MTIECGMRFLTDYIDGDKYFKTNFDKSSLIINVADCCDEEIKTQTEDEVANDFNKEEYLSKIEGIIPAIESAHAVAHAIKLAPTMNKDEIMIVCLSGRGDKDVAAIAKYRGLSTPLNFAIQNSLSVGVQHVENEIFPGRMKHFRICNFAAYTEAFSGNLPYWVGA